MIFGITFRTPLLFALLLALVAQPLSGSAAPPKPSECLAEPAQAVASAVYGGKTYHFKSQACKEEFLTDPERYSQLYDALIELKAQGRQPAKPAASEASLVPS